MSLLHYIDNEVPAYGEWDSIVESGTSTIVQSAAAAWPERGSLGLRCTTNAAAAYAQKNLSAAIADDGDLYTGFWYNVRSEPAFLAHPYALFNTAGTSWTALMYYRNGGTAYLYARADDGSSASVIEWNILTLSRWYWVVVRTHRASSAVAADGYVSLYVDGVLIGSTATVDNYDIMSAPSSLSVGARYYYDAGYVADQDEIKISTSYPEPFSPTPADEYPQASRTVVLFRQGNSDSMAFADYCVSELGVPRANLCPLPNATANESLASYATFKTEVETDLAAWLALNPTVAANCSCFLIGYGVPGYFTRGGVKHSATSRLMNYGTAFSSQTANPLYLGGTGVPPVRLTKTAMGGKYLCTRIDADTLANAKLIIDRAATVSALSALAATDILYSDDATYPTSLACQRLRIITDGPVETMINDAFAFGDLDPKYYSTAGARAAFVDPTLSSADSLRSVGTTCQKALAHSYAAALGSSETAGTFDAESFFEMLRIGGTLAEAFAVAIANIDYVAVSVGSPVMTVAFALGGYNVYRHVGGVDWTAATIAAYLRAGVAQAILTSLGHTADATYYYGVRAVSDSGVEETGVAAIVRVIVDALGNLVGLPPPKLIWAEASAAAAGKIDLSFRYDAPASSRYDDAVGVQVARVTAGIADWDNPLNIDGAAQVDVSGDTIKKNCQLDDTFADAETVDLAVRAITALSVGGAEIRMGVIADASGPDAVSYLSAAQA